MVQQGATTINNIAVANGGEKIFYVTGISTPGLTGFWEVTIDMAAHYLVPTFCMTIFGWAGYQIAQRQYLLDNVNADFVRTARAKGLTRNRYYPSRSAACPSFPWRVHRSQHSAVFAGCILRRERVRVAR